MSDEKDKTIKRRGFLGALLGAPIIGSGLVHASSKPICVYKPRGQDLDDEVALQFMKYVPAGYNAHFGEKRYAESKKAHSILYFHPSRDMDAANLVLARIIQNGFMIARVDKKQCEILVKDSAGKILVIGRGDTPQHSISLAAIGLLKIAK